MADQLTVIPSTGISLGEIVQILKTTTYQGFPIVQDHSSPLILGYINRSELKYAIGTFPPPSISPNKI